MKYKSQLITGACLAALALTAPSSVLARAKKSASPAPEASASPTATASPAEKMRSYPFHGMIASVDEKMKTFTIAGKEKSRTFKITDKSVITKADQPATIKDVTANEEVRGSYWKQADGTMEARTIKLGPLSEDEKAAKEARKQKRAAKKAAAEPSPSATP